MGAGARRRRLHRLDSRLAFEAVVARAGGGVRRAGIAPGSFQLCARDGLSRVTRAARDSAGGGHTARRRHGHRARVGGRRARGREARVRPQGRHRARPDRSSHSETPGGHRPPLSRHPVSLGRQHARRVRLFGCSPACLLLHGVQLPRDSDMQARIGHERRIQGPGDIRPGDLLFFGKSRDSITHVGLVLPDRTFLHAYGQVIVNSLDTGHEHYDERLASIWRMTRNPLAGRVRNVWRDPSPPGNPLRAIQKNVDRFFGRPITFALKAGRPLKRTFFPGASHLCSQRGAGRRAGGRRPKGRAI
jgi:hypothetical protein